MNILAKDNNNLESIWMVKEYALFANNLTFESVILKKYRSTILLFYFIVIKYFETLCQQPILLSHIHAA